VLLYHHSALHSKPDGRGQAPPTRDRTGRISPLLFRIDLIMDDMTRLDWLPGEDAFTVRYLAETRERKMTGKNENPGFRHIG
jgi:hypothetical protein